MMKLLIFFFIFATICSGLVLYNNFSATGINGYAPSFNINIMYTSLGNNNWKTENQVLLQTIVDGINSIFFIVFIIYWRYKSNRI